MNRLIQLHQEHGFEFATDVDLKINNLTKILSSTAINAENKKIIANVLEELCEYSLTAQNVQGINKITFFGGARAKNDSPEYQMAKSFAKKMTDKGYKVVNGGGPGVMQASSEGATYKNAIGYSLKLPFEDGVNEFLKSSENVVECKYFFTRKLMLVRQSAAIVVFPGGFGTMDELFEVLTLLQNAKTDAVPLVLMAAKGSGFWDHYIKFVDTSKDFGFISELERGMIYICEDEQAAIDYIDLFYSRYIGLQKFDDYLLVSLKEKLPEKLFEQIKFEFSEFLGPDSMNYVELEGNDTICLKVNYDPKQARVIFHFIKSLNS